MIRISIIIPTYKGCFLRQAIDSVLAQTYQHWELIIVDDCSPEDIYAIVAPYLSNKRIRYQRNAINYGAERLAYNWTQSLDYCTGDYVICMGDDDMLTPHALEEYVRMAEKYPEVNVIHGQTEIIDETGDVIELMEPRWEKENVLQAIYYRWAGLGRQQFIGDFCYKLASLRQQGGYYDLPLAWGSDDITAFIATATNGIANTQNICFYYRKNRYSISYDTNCLKKIQALRMQEQWYRQFLDSYICKTREDHIAVNLLKNLLPVHFYFHTNDLLRKDISYRIWHTVYWILHRKQYSLSFKQIIIQSIKSLKRQCPKE